MTGSRNQKTQIAASRALAAGLLAAGSLLSVGLLTGNAIAQPPNRLPWAPTAFP